MRYNLNNFSNIRLSLAVNTPSDAVTVEMETNENEVSKSTQEYIKYCNILFNNLNSETLLIDDNDLRKQLLNINQWYL